MQAVMGSGLAVVYASDLRKAFAHLPPAEASQLSDEMAKRIVSSFQGAEQVAQGFPEAQASELIEVAAAAFTQGKGLAYLLGHFMMLIVLVLVLWKYPRKSVEQALFASMAARDRRNEPEGGSVTLPG
ncbi:MAG: hypothetical protein Q8P61_07435 [Candidatus Nanopelagicales bacterium]|nr:hypothetical protein [Candidatus Nanopelagicales bacterium]